MFAVCVLRGEDVLYRTVQTHSMCCHRLSCTFKSASMNGKAFLMELEHLMDDTEFVQVVLISPARNVCFPLNKPLKSEIIYSDSL